MNKYLVAVFAVIVFNQFIFAHCDTMDGPVIADARKTIEQKNVNYVLKWVKPENEKEIRMALDLIKKVRTLTPEAKELSDKYFFDTLIRLHRIGEGVGFTGVKPSGTPVDEKITAADKSIEIGNLFPLDGLVPENKMPELKKRFDKVLSLKNFDVNNVTAGREYVDAYVQFFHFAEGEAEGHKHGHGEIGHLLSILPWLLSGIFFITTLVFGYNKFKKN